MIENSRKMLGAYDPEDVHLLAGGGGGGVFSTFKSYFRVQAKPLERFSIGHFHDGVIYYKRGCLHPLLFTIITRIHLFHFPFSIALVSTRKQKKTEGFW